MGLSVGTGILCIFGKFGLVFSLSCFVLRKLTQSVLRYSQKEPFLFPGQSSQVFSLLLT